MIKPDTKRIIISLVCNILVLILTVSLFFYVYNIVSRYSNCCMCGTIENDCCPCPNKLWFKTVNDWSEYKASSAGSWLTICEEYKEAHNETFECFK